jgi:ribosomal protein S7
MKQAIDKSIRVLDAKHYLLKYYEKYGLDVETYNPSNPLRSFVNWFYDIKDTPMTVINPTVGKEYYGTTATISYGHIDLGRDDIPDEDKNNIKRLSAILNEVSYAKKSFFNDQSQSLKIQNNLLTSLAEKEENQEAIGFLKKAGSLINKTDHDVGILFGDIDEGVGIGILDILGTILNEVSFGGIESIEGIFRDGVTTVENGFLQTMSETNNNNKAIEIINDAVNKGIPEMEYNVLQRAAKSYLDALEYRESYKQEYATNYTPESMLDRYKDDVSSMFGFITVLSLSGKLFRAVLKGTNTAIKKIAPKAAMESTFIKNAQSGTILGESLKLHTSFPARFKYMMAESTKGIIPFTLATTAESVVSPLFYNNLAQEMKKDLDIVSLYAFNDNGELEKQQKVIDTEDKRKAIHGELSLLRDEAMREKENRDYKLPEDIKKKNLIPNRFANISYDQLTSLINEYTYAIIKMCEPGYSGLTFTDADGIEHEDKATIIRKDKNVSSHTGSSLYTTSIESNSERIGGFGINTYFKHLVNKLNRILIAQGKSNRFTRLFSNLVTRNRPIQNIGNYPEEQLEEVTGAAFREFDPFSKFQYGCDYFFDNLGGEVKESVSPDAMSSLINPMALTETMSVASKLLPRKKLHKMLHIK